MMDTLKFVPKEARGENERPYDPQAYFQEVIEVHNKKEEEKRGRGAGKERKPLRQSKIGKSLEEILRRRLDDPHDKSWDNLVTKIYPKESDRCSEREIKFIRNGILEGAFADNEKIVVNMALDEEGRITDPEIARAYIDDRREEIQKSIEDLKRKIEEAEKKLKSSQAELEQWTKVLELAAVGLNNETQAQIIAAGEVIRSINDSKEKTEKDVEGARQSVEESGGYKKTIESLAKELERLEKIKANIE